MTTPAEWLDNSCNRCTQEGQTATYLAPITPGVLPSDDGVSNIGAYPQVPTYSSCDPAACMPGVATPDQCPECRAAPGAPHAAGCQTIVDNSIFPDSGNLNSGEPYSGFLVGSLTERFGRCVGIAASKNQDYANSSDPFANFRRSEMVGVDPGRAILVRVTDKLCRISNLLEAEGAVKDESISDSIDDAINYLAILGAWLARDRVNDEGTA